MVNFLRGTDWILFFSMLFLASLSVLMVYSTSIEADGVDYSFVVRQASYVIFGIIVYFIITRIDYKLLSHFSFLLYASVVALLIATFFIGETTRGSVRWIDLKFITIQASEIAKPIIILTLAYFFSKYPPNQLKNVLASFLIVSVPALLVFLQPDLGNTLIILSLWVILVFAAGIKFFHIGLFALANLLIMPILWSYLRGYQRERLASFLSPEKDPQGSGYNLVQSIIAVGSGGLVGRGFGRGTQTHLNFLPEQKTDFIFATTAEELGFLGVSLMLGAFAVIIYRIITISKQNSDNLSSYIALGVASTIVIHTLINIGMNIGLFPITGITLPLLSFGGSSMLSVMISLGLVNSIAAHQEKSIKS